MPWKPHISTSWFLSAIMPRGGRTEQWDLRGWGGVDARCILYQHFSFDKNVVYNFVWIGSDAAREMYDIILAHNLLSFATQWSVKPLRNHVLYAIIRLKDILQWGLIMTADSCASSVHVVNVRRLSLINRCDFDKIEVLYFAGVRNITVKEIEDMILIDLWNFYKRYPF